MGMVAMESELGIGIGCEAIGIQRKYRAWGLRGRGRAWKILLSKSISIGSRGYLKLKHNGSNSSLSSPASGSNSWLHVSTPRMVGTVVYENASQVVNDVVGSIRKVESFSAEEKVMELYKKKCEGPMRIRIRHGLISGIGFGVSFCLLFCVNAASFYAGARLVHAGKTSFDKEFRSRVNMAYGKEERVSEAKIIIASESAKAHKFISTLQQVEQGFFMGVVSFSHRLRLEKYC